MSYRIVGCLWLCALLFALWAQPVTAGGWVVVTLDELPIELQAGEPVQIGFQAMQHGVHPLEMADGEVVVVAWHTTGQETIEVPARAWGLPGHYTAELILPSAGLWAWEIRPGGFPAATMPNLTVIPGQAEQTQGPPPIGQADWRWMIGQILSLLQLPMAPVEADAEPITEASNEELATYGKALFRAKGCVTCHIHADVPAEFSLAVGPELSDYTVIPEYVAVWLRDPKSIKPRTAMPTLPLDDAEIDALIAFLSYQ